jgi:hypothetical protein
MIFYFKTRTEHFGDQLRQSQREAGAYWAIGGESRGKQASF